VLVTGAGERHAVASRFVPTETSESDVLVFLEDMGRLQEQAQQMKLAALGRLTANIAHEIRNPLSAISHAGELLREERRGEMYERLLRIVLDNTQRLERIVSDVLELGRRDRSYRELINLREALPLFVEEYLVKENLPADVLTLELSGWPRSLFRSFAFHQVLWNLLGNALRHSQRAAAAFAWSFVMAGPLGRSNCMSSTMVRASMMPAANRFSSRSSPRITAVPVWVSISRASCAKRMERSSNCRAPGRVPIFVSWGGLRVSAGKTERRPRGELARVLVVDDEADIRELLDLTVARMGLSADCAASVARRGSCSNSSAINCALPTCDCPTERVWRSCG
jgi:hypothetical protein